MSAIIGEKIVELDFAPTEYTLRSGIEKNRMRRINTIFVVILLLAGCGENKQPNDDLIIVDVSKSYPMKELILQDFMDVEYIALETTDEFITQGLVQDVGKEYVLVKNLINDGDLFIFDRKTGKGLRKINRKGQGPEEYASLNGGIILDEANGEIFVKSPPNKYLVYDLYGQFKRSLDFSRDVSSVTDFDKDNFIYYDISDYYNKGEDRSKSYHVLISKSDGSITREIFIPFKTINTPVVQIGDGFPAQGYYQHMRLSQDNCILMEPSSDTLYNYTPDGTLSPFLVRTPSTPTMETEVFLYLGIFTDRYYFMQTFQNTFDFEKRIGFNTAPLMYDKEENALFQFTVYNDDFVEKKPVSMLRRSMNREIQEGTKIDADQLVDNYKKGQLKDGKLKEIASKLDEDDNPVIMLIKHRSQ